MSQAVTPVVLGPGEGHVVEGPAGGPLTFKLRGEQSGGALTVIENVIGPGDGPPLHAHANEDEAWHVIEGSLRFRLGDTLHLAPAGSFVYVPRGVAHCFQNIGTSPARLLVLFSPSGMERFFDRFAALSTPDPSAFAAIGSEVGMSVLGQPLAMSHPL